MRRIYVPYSGEVPACLLINGHKLLLLSGDAEIGEDTLEALGADHLEIIRGGDTPPETEKVLSALAEKVRAGVVLIPGEISYDDLIRNLENQLPWVQ